MNKIMKYYHRQIFALFLSIIFLFPTFIQAQEWVQMGENIAGKEKVELLGSSVSLSADGKTVAIGAEGRAGHIKVYTWNDEGNWVQKGSSIQNEGGNSTEGFGKIVSLSADGNVVAIGAHRKKTTKGIDNEGQVKVYAWNGTDWVQKGKNIDGITENSPENQHAGSSISLSGDGNTLVMNGKYMSIYTWDGQSWIETFNKKVVIRKGVSISSDGKTVAMAASFLDNSGSSTPYQVLILEWNGTKWVQKGNNILIHKDLYKRNPTVSDQLATITFGTSLGLSANGKRLVLSETENSILNKDYHTRVYEWNGSDWVQKGEDMYTKDEKTSGYSVSIAADGNTVTTGGDDFAFVYAWDGQKWELIQEALQSANPNNHASISLSADGSIIAVGSCYDEKSKKKGWSGIVRVYQLKE